MARHREHQTAASEQLGFHAYGHAALTLITLRRRSHKYAFVARFGGAEFMFGGGDEEGVSLLFQFLDFIFLDIH